MVGSKKWFIYDDDVAEKWGYQADESNQEIFGVAHDANLGTLRYAMPSNLQPRRANYASTTTVRKRSIVVPTKALYDNLASGSQTATGLTFVDPDLNETFILIGLSPERIRPIIIPNDTGLNDGDLT